VIRFAYGQYEDNKEVVLWVAGNGRWYKLEPARTYKPHFQMMVEAVKVLYFVADTCRGKSPAPLTEALFAEV
jgi:hypothetical protein